MMEKIRKEMEKEGLGVLLLYGKGPDEYGNPCYLSNYISGMPRGVLVVVPRQGEPLLPVPAPGSHPPHEHLASPHESCRGVDQPAPLAIQGRDPGALLRVDAVEAVCRAIEVRGVGTMPSAKGMGTLVIFQPIVSLSSLYGFLQFPRKVLILGGL